MDTRSVVQFLTENLGSRLVAHIAGVDHQPVGRWVSQGNHQPRSESERKLPAAHQVFQERQAVQPGRRSAVRDRNGIDPKLRAGRLL